MNKRLKSEIIMWLISHEFEHQRVNSCVSEFMIYIYDSSGEYLSYGEEIYEFIVAADKLLYE